MSYQFPWYDSHWLSAYWQAVDLIKQNHPDRLEEFVQAFDVLQTPTTFKAKKLDSILSVDRLSELRELIVNLKPDQLEKQELLTFGRFVVHDHSLFNEIQIELTDKMSELVSEEVEPSYNFLSLYNNLGYCAPHMDAPNAKWTLDICLDQSDTWPIYFSKIQPWPSHTDNWDANWQKQVLEDPENKFEEHVLEKGQAAVFSGSSQWHYRKRIEQKQAKNFCNLLFFHFIPKGTKELVDPRQWFDLFKINELETLSYDDSWANYQFSVR